MSDSVKYTVYMITNLINGKTYIGCHKTKDLNDNYMGSGVNVIKAIKKYGKENFKKEYLFIFDNPQDMFEKESILVDSEFIKSDKNYNISKGGEGSFDYINENYWTPEKRKAHGLLYGSKAGSWKDRDKRIRSLECIPMEKRKEIGKRMGDTFGGQNKITPEEVQKRLKLIEDVDLTKYGWVKKVSLILKISHTTVKSFIENYYIGEVYRRKDKKGPEA